MGAGSTRFKQFLYTFYNGVLTVTQSLQTWISIVDTLHVRPDEIFLLALRA